MWCMCVCVYIYIYIYIYSSKIKEVFVIQSHLTVAQETYYYTSFSRTVDHGLLIQGKPIKTDYKFSGGQMYNKQSACI